MAEKKHILVIRFSAMGDVAMTYPVLKSLLDENPNLKITFLTRGFFSPIFKDLPQVEVFAADLKGNHKGIGGLYRLSKELKGLNISGVADLHNVLRTKILKQFLKGIPFEQLDKGRSLKKAMIKGEFFEQLPKTTGRYASVFKALGLNFNLNPSLRRHKRKMPEKGLLIARDKSTKWIGIAPFAAHRSKVYPLDQMAIVIESLSKNFQIFLFGAPGDEAEQLNGLAPKYSQVYNLAGKFNFEEELDIISNLDLMISMDSGNGHLAANFGVPVLTLWGVTHPFLGFEPHNPKINSALMADRKLFPKIPTSVYGNKYPEGYESAISSIPPESIMQSALEMLQKTNYTSS